MFNKLKEQILALCHLSPAMSEKRTVKENATYKSVDPVVLKEEISASRPRLTAASLMDLPPELLEHILLDAVVSEVRDRKLARHAWKDSADRVVDRLKNVCPQWKDLLTAKLFQESLHRILDSIPLVQVSLVVLAKHRFASAVTVTALNDELFELCRPRQQNAAINVYDRNNLKTVKTKIHLPDVTIPWDLKACSTMNCLYMLHQASRRIEIWRISKAEGQFVVSPWITCATRLVSKMSVAADGSVILYQGPVPSIISVYNPDRSLKHQIELAKHIGLLQGVIPKSNGNLVLVAKRLIQVNREGSTVYECDEPADTDEHLYYAVGIHDWMVTVDGEGEVRLLDCELNRMDVDTELESYSFNRQLYRMNYDRQRDEFLAFETDGFADSPNAGGSHRGRQCLTIFNFTESAIPKDVEKEEED